MTPTFARLVRLILGLLCSQVLLAQLRGQVVTETFMNSTAPGWVFAGTGYTPTLTSGAGDPAGNGWLRLTDTGGNEATSAYYNTAFNAAGASVYAKFDYESYGGSGADGITFFLFDGSVPFSVGSYGGSIGYAQRTVAGGGGADINGMAGGYLGVALDEYGNFSSASEGRVGGYNGTTGLVPDSIGVRGPGQGLNGYAYLGGSGTLSQSIDSATRPTQTNTVQILLTATNQLTVTLQQGGTTPQTILQMDLSGYLRPDTLKFGFAAGTGGLTNYHDVRNLNVTTLTSNLWSGGSGDNLWASNGNWDPTVVPTVGADILFDNTHVSTAQTINTGANRNVRSISFDAPFAYTLNNNTITFDNQGVAGFSGIAVTQTHGSATDTINSNLSLANAINIRNNASGTLNVNGAIATNGNAITLDGTGTTNLAGVISGTGAITKNDSGTDTLSGANTYSGGTTINNGTLNANQSTALGTGGVTLAGGTLGSTNGSTIGNTVSLTGTAAIQGLTVTGALTETGSQTLTLTNATLGAVNLSNTNTGRTLTTQVDSGTSQISGVIANGGTGAGSLTKTGAGELVLGGANTYTGTTTISSGTITLGGNDRLADASSVDLGASGTLNLNGFSERVGTLTAAGGATLDFGATGTANTFVFGTYNAPASGVLVVNNWEYGVDKLATTGPGQTVSSIYISGYGVAQESGSITNNLYGTTNAYLLTPVTVSTVEWDGSSSSSWNTGTNWTGNAKPTSGQIAVFNGAGVLQPNVTLNGGNTIAGVQFGSSASVNYNITGAKTLTLSGTVPYIQQQSANAQTLSPSTLALSNTTVVDITGSGNLTIGSAITSTSRNLIKDGTGAGKLILTGNNSGLTGSVYVNNGVVQAANTNALGTGTTYITSGAGLELSGGISPTNAISVTGTGKAGAGAIHNVSGTNTASGTITLGGDTRIASDTGSTLNLTGNVTGTNRNLELTGAGNIAVSRITTGTGGVTVNSTGTVTFNGGATANTYTGTTTVNSGTLSLSKNSGVNAVAGNLVVNGGTVQLAASNQIADSASVTLNGTGALNVNGQTETLGQLTSTSGTATVALGAGSLTLNGTNNINSSYAGALTGTAGSSLNVTGTGKVYLSGASASYAGTTNVTNGTLNVSGSNQVLGTGAVNVSSSGNLQLQGGISLSNAVAINGTGTSSNGAIENFAGNNTLSGTVTLGGASRVQSDAGTLTLGGTVALGSNTLNVGGSGTTRVTGAITGTGGITKDDSGTLRLANGSNTFSGATTISAGTVIAEASNVFNNSALLTLASGASLQLNGLNETIGALAGGGALDLGTGGTLNLTSGTGLFSGTLAGSGTIYLGTGATLTLGANFNNSNVNIVLAGGTLNLNGTTSTFGNITVTGNSVLDFGASTASVLSSSSVTFANSSVGLTVNNWVNATDYFYTQNFTGATPDARGTNPENQVTFSGNSANSTAWLSFDKQVTPVPEPGTYGAIFTALALGFVGFRRFRATRRAA
ncbi:MAG TPA: autotransporter-associated beta strand repeat-containing protein [Opitutaceae bacterium]|nr:autotransporter-associated beta strand repeat-containing protein [Opitutaceae bacterium]